MGQLSAEKVNEIYLDCLFKDEEVYNDRPLVEYTMLYTFNPTKKLYMGFNIEKINKNKKAIIEMIDCISNYSFTELEDLFIDKDGNQWCDKIVYVDLLLLLASAAEVINVNEVNGVNYIRRDHSKDNEVVRGIDPIPLTEDEINDIVIKREEEKQLREKIIKHNSEQLEENIDRVAYGFAFFGLRAEINKENKCALDLFDSEGRLVHTENFEESPGLYIEPHTVINCKNKKYNGGEIHFYLETKRENKLIVSFDEPGGKHDGVRLEIFFDEDNKVEKFDMRASYSDDAFKLVHFEIEDGFIHAQIDNEFGPRGNYVDGEHREITMSESMYKHGPFFHMREEQYPNERGESLHSVYGGLDGFVFDLVNEIDDLSYREYDSIAYNLVRHPRNKETIETVLNYFDSKVPGLKAYIKDNFIMYDYVMENDYVHSEKMDRLMDSMILEACNIDNIENRVKKIETK